MGIAALPEPLAENEHRNTGGKRSWAEFHGISNRKVLPGGHRDSGKGLGYSLGNAAPAQFALKEFQGIISHPAGAGVEASGRSCI